MAVQYAAGAPDGVMTGHPVGVLRARFALALSGAVGLFPIAVVSAVYNLDWRFAVTVAVSVVLVALHLRHAHRFIVGQPSRTPTWSLVALAIATYAPVTVLGWPWTVASALLAASLLIALPSPWRVIGFATVLLVQPSMLLLAGTDIQAAWYETVRTGLLALMSYGLVVFAANVRELRSARTQLAELEVALARFAFTRDVHDLLGHGLAAVMLRGEVAAVHLDRGDIAAASRELRQLLLTAREAGHGLRSLVDGCPPVSLRDELPRVIDLLETSGVSCEVRTSRLDDLSDAADQTLGWVLREAAANVLRHSMARACRISITAGLDSARLEVENDGVGLGRLVQHPADANQTLQQFGLGGIASRIAALHGVTEAGPTGNTSFRLSVRIPTVQPAGGRGLA